MFLEITNRLRTRAIIKSVIEYLPIQGRVLDVGAGSCHVAATLNNLNGFAVTAVDTVDHSINDYPLAVYDGKRLPYDDASFDAGLLIFVLHHAENIEALLKEAGRVSRRLIVIEDTPYRQWERKVWKKLDYMENHAQRSDINVAHEAKSPAEWRAVFSECGFVTVHEKPFRSLATTGYTYPHTVFVIEPSRR